MGVLVVTRLVTVMPGELMRDCRTVAEYWSEPKKVMGVGVVMRKIIPQRRWG